MKSNGINHDRAGGGMPLAYQELFAGDVVTLRRVVLERSEDPVFSGRDLGRIRAQATEWVLRFDSGELTWQGLEARYDALLEWVTQSKTHLRTYLQMAELDECLGRCSLDEEPDREAVMKGRQCIFRAEGQDFVGAALVSAAGIQMEARHWAPDGDVIDGRGQAEGAVRMFTLQDMQFIYHVLDPATCASGSDDRDRSVAQEVLLMRVRERMKGLVGALDSQGEPVGSGA